MPLKQHNSISHWTSKPLVRHQLMILMTSKAGHISCLVSLLNSWWPFRNMLFLLGCQLWVRWCNQRPLRNVILWKWNSLIFLRFFLMRETDKKIAEYISSLQFLNDKIYIYKGQFKHLRIEVFQNCSAFFVCQFLSWETPCWSVLDFWKIKLEKSSSMNWIFSLFQTGFLLPV